MTVDSCVPQDPALSKLRHGLVEGRTEHDDAWRTEAIKDLARRLVLTSAVLSQDATAADDTDCYDESDAEVDRDYATQVLFKIDSHDLHLVLEALLSIHQRMFNEWVAIAGGSSDEIAAIADGLDEDDEDDEDEDDEDDEDVFQALARGLVDASRGLPDCTNAVADQLTRTALTAVFAAAPPHFQTLVLTAVEGLTAMLAIARSQHHPAGKFSWLEYEPQERTARYTMTGCPPDVTDPYAYPWCRH